MTDKEELIRAAETLKKYCHYERNTPTCRRADSNCLLSEVCECLPCWYDMERAMKDIIHAVRCSDD